MINSRSPLVSLLIASALALAGCGGKSPEDHLRQGKALAEKGDMQGAIVALKNALQARPDDAEARLQLGKLYLKTGDFPSAVKELNKAKDKGAAESAVLPALASALVASSQFQAALDLGIPTNAFGPDASAALFVARANALSGLGKKEDAQSALAKAEAVAPRHPDLTLFKARQAIEQKDVAKAMQLVESVLKQDPRQLDALYLKGKLLESGDTPEQALKVYEAIVAADRRQHRAHLAMFNLNLRAGKQEIAEKNLVEAEKLAEKFPIVLYSRGIFELRRGRFKEANEALQSVLKAVPDHVPTLLALAMANFNLGNYEQSLRNAQLAWTADPSNPLAARLVIASQLRTGATRPALKNVKEALEARPDDPDLLALAGEAFQRAGEGKRAAQYLEKAAALSPDDPNLKTRLAASHLERGQGSKALEELEQAIKLDDKVGKADLALITLHIQRKQYDKALEAVAALEKKLPNSPITHNMRGTALMGKGQRAEARKAFEQALHIAPSFFPAVAALAALDIQDRNPTAARKRFESHLSQNKKDIKAMLALADLAAQQKDQAAFVDWLNKVRKVDPKALIAYHRLVEFHLAKKDKKQAMAIAKEATLAMPDSLDALNVLGNAQLRSGETKEALATFTKLASKSPDSPDALLRLAIAQGADKQLAESRKTLERALALKPDHAHVLDALIGLEAAGNNLGAALRHARSLQNADPGSPLGFLREGDLQVAMKQHAQAAKSYGAALDRGADSQTMVKYYKAHQLAGNTKLAQDKLAIWLKQHPRDIPVRLYHAEDLMAKGKRREAIALYETIVRLAPGNAVALNNLADLYRQEKDPRALATAERAFKIAPANAGIQDTLGWLLFGQGQYARAETLLQKAATQTPRAASIRYHYGAALARAGKKADAVRELDAALSGEIAASERAEAKALRATLN